MSTWQILSDTGNNFRWEISGQDIGIKPEAQSPGVPIQRHSSISHLPSMRDVLLQGCSKLQQDCDGGVDSSPILHPGLGKSGVARQSSVPKTLPVIEKDDSIDRRCPKHTEGCGVGVESSPMFRTGSGKSVLVKQSSMEKASSVLGEDDRIDKGCPKHMEDTGVGVQSFPMFQTGSGKSVIVKQSSMTKALSVLKEDDIIDKGCPKHMEDSGVGVQSFPMFQTGSGKSVVVKQSSMAKALSVLREDDRIDNGFPEHMEDSRVDVQSFPMFQTGSGKSVAIKQSSMAKALSVLGEDDIINKGCSKLLEHCGGGGDDVKSSPMFHTGLGKSIVVKQSSITKASSFFKEDGTVDKGCLKSLGVHGGVEGSPMFRTGLGKSVVVKQSSITKALSVLEEDEKIDRGRSKLPEDCGGVFQTGLGKPVGVKQFPIEKAFSGLGEDNTVGVGVKAKNNGCNFSNSLFQTGSGKVVSISSAGIVRAKTLLGLEEKNDNSTFQDMECTNEPSPTNTNEKNGWQNSSNLEIRKGVNHMGIMDATLVPRLQFSSEAGLMVSEPKKEALPNLMQSEMCTPALKPAPIKFHTASGRSIAVSSDALQRARSLLGDPDLGTSINEGDANDIVFSLSGERQFNDISLRKDNDPYVSLSHQEMAKSKHTPNNFISPLRSSSTRSSILSENRISGINLLKKFNADDDEYNRRPSSDTSCLQKPTSNMRSPHIVTENSMLNCFGSRVNPRESCGPLVDISNTIGTTHANKKQPINEKRRFGRSSVSPFKRPRNSRFSTPLNSNLLPVPNGLSTLAPGSSRCKRRVSTHYPFEVARMYVNEYFGVRPSHQNMFESLPDQLRRMNPENAEKYLFLDESGQPCIGVEAIHHMLAQSGASMLHASKEWVGNHYKWIVWKLACYDRRYPAKCSGSFLTVSNVLEELKYRYEREVNHGHRSIIKRILEGDASPSSMMVLCISAIRSDFDTKTESNPMALDGAENSNVTKIELTDGWYSMDASLDALLSKQLAAGKLFVGQKLRIWGAGLCCWVAPVSPLEASRTSSLSLHINGTYRAHWADRLGLCKGICAPLAFRCIKSSGGPVPKTLVGLKRIYPVLYKERSNDGVSIVRPERMEAKMMQLYNQRRAVIVEGIVSEFQRGIKDSCMNNDYDSEEGAKILKILETAAEPEVIMAEMSSEQLNSFTTYQAKLEAIRQSDMRKSVENALKKAGLSARQVTPFMRVRVVGLNSKSYQGNCCHKEGLITIWNPTEKQRFELVEGQAYTVAGLVPVNSDSETLYLQARGSTTKWKPLSPMEIGNFEPFFSPRKAVFLSSLGEVPLSSEFDVAALVVYVGEVYTAGHQKKQWVFVTDGSKSELQSHGSSNSLLAISFCSPHGGDDSSAPINYNLAGSTVGFCNVIKRAKDQMNHLWVAEATENSTYFVNNDLSHCSHLKSAAASVENWAKISSMNIEKLRKKVLSITGDSI